MTKQEYIEKLEIVEKEIEKIKQETKGYIFIYPTESFNEIQELKRIRMKIIRRYLLTGL